MPPYTRSSFEHLKVKLDEFSEVCPAGNTYQTVKGLARLFKSII